MADAPCRDKIDGVCGNIVKVLVYSIRGRYSMSLLSDVGRGTGYLSYFAAHPSHVLTLMHDAAGLTGPCPVHRVGRIEAVGGRVIFCSTAKNRKALADSMAR
jgi:hypothetical protein